VVGAPYFVDSRIEDGNNPASRLGHLAAERPAKGGRMVETNLTRAREAFDAFSRGDFQAYRNYFADDVVWHVSGNHPLSGSYRGKEALFEYFDRVRELTDASLRVEPESVSADDGHVGVFARVTAERDGRRLDVTMAQAFTVDADGKWTEYWAMANDQAAVDEFWS
jgi:ketosteroid isomerase-like protein